MVIHARVWRALPSAVLGSRPSPAASLHDPMHWIQYWAFSFQAEGRDQIKERIAKDPTHETNEIETQLPPPPHPLIDAHWLVISSKNKNKNVP